MSVLDSLYFLIYYHDHHRLVNITNPTETLFMTFLWINCICKWGNVFQAEMWENAGMLLV